MIYLAIGGGVAILALLAAFFWQRAAAARAEKTAAEQEQLAASLTAALEQAQKSKTDQDQRYEELVRYWQSKVKELEGALDACLHDPVAVRARLRELLSVPAPAADRGGKTGGPVPL
jgi:hypothetical protein